MININALVDRLCYRYPSTLVDAIVEHDAGRRLVAVKNVTVNEEFFQGHFPGTPLMPAVLMLESLSQVAAVLLLHREGGAPNARVYAAGLQRRQVPAPDRAGRSAAGWRFRSAGAARRWRARRRRRTSATRWWRRRNCCWASCPTGPQIDATAIVHPDAFVGQGTTIGPHAVIGAHVRIGANCTIDASAVVDGWTDIGDETEIFPFASIGLIPQDLKFKGEPHAAVDRPAQHLPRVRDDQPRHARRRRRHEIGDHNVFMAYVHVAHDCHIGNDTIFGPHATLGGHVTVEDFANISAGSAVHQFCRVGRHGFIGGYSVVTKDALPFARTVGSRPARIFGVNTIGLARRGLHARHHREAEAVVPLPAAVQAQHDEGAAADRAGSIAVVRRSGVPRRLHPHLAARRHPSPRDAAGRRSARR